MGTRSRALVISSEERIFLDIRQALSNSNDIDQCEWKETLIAGLAFIRQSKPNIIFLDEELCFPDVSTAVKEFTAKLPETRIILLAQMGRRDKIDAAILSGAVGYLLKPLDNSEVEATVQRVLANFTPELTAPMIQSCLTQTGKIISTFSTVDGVGKTTIAVNLAVLLAKLSGKKICLIDADLQFGDVCRFLHMDPSLTIVDFASREAVNRHSCREYLQSWNELIDVFAAPPKPEQSSLVTPSMIVEVIKELACEYNYVVIDTTVGFTDVGLEILELSNSILFVNTLDSISCVKNLRLGMDTLRDLKYTQDKVHLVLNRYKAKTAIGIAEVEKAINSSFAVKIGNDFATAAGALQAQQPMVLYQPDRDVSQDILTLAKRIVENTLIDNPKQSSITDRLSRWLKG
ncbi:MAG: hypothetical protein H6Q66_377 [Firmicutes bacterium]|nr:hypothetical protein [Bacillota bacterium]